MFDQRRMPRQLLSFAVFVILFGGATIGLGRTPLKFDEFGKLSCSDELLRLDNYGNKLRTVPDALAVVVVYGGRFGTRRGEVVARLFAIRDVLIRRDSIESKRIVLLDGGFRETFAVELWVIPADGRDSVKYLVTSNVAPASVHVSEHPVTSWVYDCDRTLR